MIPRQLILPTTLLLVCLCTCQSGSETDEFYKTAFEKQTQAISYLEEIHKILDADTTGVFDRLSLSIHNLEESLFPIPGYSLNLPGHQGHDHGHTKIELSAEEILAIQVDLLQQLQTIKSTLTYD